ncbi:hypothetical protein ScPMuIL_016837 [Solemya velum]
MNTIEVLTILLLILACISITWPSNVIDLEQERNKRNKKTSESCIGVFYECYWNASTPRRRRYCVLRFAKCSIQSENIDDSFQRLRREYKAQLDFFQELFDVDWRVFEESVLFQEFENGDIQSILLSDSAYTCHSYMLTPLSNSATPEEERYNQAQKRTRRIIEQAFRVWKRRFRCVGDRTSLRCKLQLNMVLVVTTACLHNLAIQRQDPMPDDEDADNDVAPVLFQQPPAENNRLDANNHGNIFRQRFIRQHF